MHFQWNVYLQVTFLTTIYKVHKIGELFLRGEKADWKEKNNC